MAAAVGISTLARRVKGRIIGSHQAKIRVTGTCAIDDYIPSKVSFVKNEKYGKLLAGLRDAIVLVPEKRAELCQRYPQNTYILVDDVLDAMMDLQDFFYGQRVSGEVGISPAALVDPDARIAKDVYIGANACIGKGVIIGERVKIFSNAYIRSEVVIGDNTSIGPSVYIHDRCLIGKNCLIRAGTAIGVDGFRFEQNPEQKRVRKWLHAGGVKIGDRVDIGANVAIARATFEDNFTVIGDDVKIDNLVHIAHNARIGARTIIVTQTCVGGSCVIGEDVWIGIGASISNGVHIGDRARVLLNAVVAYDIPAGEIVSGFYAMPHRQWKRVYRKLKAESE